MPFTIFHTVIYSKHLHIYGIFQAYIILTHKYGDSHNKLWLWRLGELESTWTRPTNLSEQKEKERDRDRALYSLPPPFHPHFTRFARYPSKHSSQVTCMYVLGKGVMLMRVCWGDCVRTMLDAGGRWRLCANYTTIKLAAYIDMCALFVVFAPSGFWPGWMRTRKQRQIANARTHSFLDKYRLVLYIYVIAVCKRAMSEHLKYIP